MGDSEEMTVEVENDEGEVEFENVNRELQTSWIDLLMYYWFLVVLIFVTSVYMYRKYLAPKIAKWLQERSDREFEARLHKDPDLIRAREEAVQAARRRMQEEHDAIAIRKAEERKAREEKKREEMLSRQAGITPNVGRTLGDGDRVAKKPSPDERRGYNPLMGSGSGGGYRPSRRTCPGGGCG